MERKRFLRTGKEKVIFLKLYKKIVIIITRVFFSTNLLILLAFRKYTKIKIMKLVNYIVRAFGRVKHFN